MELLEIKPVGEFNILEILEIDNGKRHRRTIRPDCEIQNNEHPEVILAIKKYHKSDVKSAYQDYLDNEVMT